MSQRLRSTVATPDTPSLIRAVDCCKQGSVLNIKQRSCSSDWFIYDTYTWVINSHQNLSAPNQWLFLLNALTVRYWWPRAPDWYPWSSRRNVILGACAASLRVLKIEQSIVYLLRLWIVHVLLLHTMCLWKFPFKLDDVVELGVKFREGGFSIRGTTSSGHWRVRKRVIYKSIYRFRFITILTFGRKVKIVINFQPIYKSGPVSIYNPYL